MKPLIDMDVLVYEIGSCGQGKDEDGNVFVRDFEYVAELLDQRIKEICNEVWADEEPVLYITGDEKLFKRINRKKTGVLEFKPNFRVAAAKTKVYKGQRKQEKPFHYHNIRAYVIDKYETVVTNGIEADDAICIETYKAYREGRNDVIACTRDKDLRMVPGQHFGWACGKQPQFGPTTVSPIGSLEIYGTPKKIRGTGDKFFYSQLITGDTVDNIPGLPKGGPVLAYNTLSHLHSEDELYQAVSELYRGRIGDGWEDYLQEQADLLYMIREINEDGTYKTWEPPLRWVGQAES